MNVLYWAVICATKFFFRCCFRHHVYGLESIYQGGAILAGNHTSFYDPPLVSASWPEPVHFLARESLFRNYLFGSFIRACNAHPVAGDVADISTFKIICQLLTEGKKVVLFPEGTRAANNELGVVKPGIGFLIARANAAIIPVYIHGAYTAWPRHRWFPKLWGKTACVFGTPIRWSEFAHLEKKQAYEAVAERLTQALSALKVWYDSGAQGTPP